MSKKKAKPTPVMTGKPMDLLQDNCPKLSKWFASRPDAMLHAREAAAAIRSTSDTPYQRLSNA